MHGDGYIADFAASYFSEGKCGRGTVRVLPEDAALPDKRIVETQTKPNCQRKGPARGRFAFGGVSFS